MPAYERRGLERIAALLLQALGAPETTAGVVAESLVECDRLGLPSHGLHRITMYEEMITGARLDPQAEPRVAHETPSTALIDGCTSFGQLSARLVARTGIAKASQWGVAVIGAYHISHVGRLGEYTELVAREGLAALAFDGGAAPGVTPNVAPFGGTRAVWGTNPLAIALPTGEQVFSLDFATSAIAGGRTAIARAQGAELPEGLAIDAQGAPTRDPWSLLRGGAILPFGEHKGYALSFAVELLAGALIGASAPETPAGEVGHGFLMIVFDPGFFRPIGSFQGAAATLFRRVKQCPPAQGHSEVMVPGEPETRRRKLADDAGIPISEGIRAEVDMLARRLGLTLTWTELPDGRTS